jgi:hypothetical protein
MAVGQKNSGTVHLGLAEEYNNGSWTLSPLPNVPNNSFMYGVSCTSSIACTAVGIYVVGGASTPVIDRWDGTAWSLQTVPSVPGFTELYGVSCVANFDWCMAVGSTSNGVLALRWNGTDWSIATPPGTAVGDELYGVSCTQRGACTAVGFNQSFSTFHGVIERWSGTNTWTSQTPADSNDRLGRVSCASSTFCVAVAHQPLDHLDAEIEMWNGAIWSKPFSGNYFDLEGVSCPTPTNCMAVGHAQNDPEPPVAYQWNGSNWNATSMPAPAGSTATLPGGISCPTTSLCRTVGAWAPSRTLDDYRPLAERWS